MKKIILIFLFLVVYGAMASAQNIKDVVKSIPDHVIHGLDDDQKEILASIAKDTATVEVLDNNLYESIKRIAFSEDFISLQTSTVGTVQIKLLPLINDSKVICVVKTVCRDICDSKVRFYTTKWQPIQEANLLPPTDLNWFIKNDLDRNSDDFKNAVSVLDIAPVKVILSPTDQKLVAKYDIEKYLSKDDYKRLQPFLVGEPKVLTWDKNSFK